MNKLIDILKKIISVFFSCLSIVLIICILFSGSSILEILGFIFIFLPLFSPFRNFVVKYFQSKKRYLIYACICIVGFIVFAIATPSDLKYVDDETQSVKLNKEDVDKNKNYNNSDENKKQENKENTNNELIKEDEYDSDSIGYISLIDAWNYAKEKNIDIYNFSERKKVFDFLTKNNLQDIISNSIFVKESTSFIKSIVSYKQTLNEANILYYGGLNKENKPQGLGVLFELKDEHGFYDTNSIFIKYIGYFDNGSFDGYGLLSNIEKISSIGEISQKRIINENPTISISMDIIEGYFEDSKANGKVVQYSKVSDINEEDVYSPNNPIIYNFTIGEYKNNEWDGKIKDYIQGFLHYSGTTKKGNYNDNGTLYYYNSNQIKYKGEFLNGYYDGKGTLYNEDGTIKYSGEFEAGDIK